MKCIIIFAVLVGVVFTNPILEEIQPKTPLDDYIDDNPGIHAKTSHHNINTKSNDNLNQNDPQNEVHIFSIHNEDNEVRIKKFRDDYTLYPGFGYYKYHNYGAMWLNAKYICELEGAHLVVLNSQAEADLILWILKTYPEAINVPYPDYISVGFHDMFKPGEYVTVLGGLLNETGYVKWNEGQPNGGTQNCGYMKFNGFFFDDYCSEIYSFMCEKEL